MPAGLGQRRRYLNDMVPTSGDHLCSSECALHILLASSQRLHKVLASTAQIDVFPSAVGGRAPLKRAVDALDPGVEISLAQLPPAAFDTVDVRHPNLVAARAALTP